jgi:prolipoprotein diacylglyceryltransferase
MEFTLLGAALVAVMAGYGVLWWEAGRTNAADCTRDVWDALVTALVGGLVAGRLAAMVIAGTNPVTNPGDVIIVRGGVDTVAASVAGVLTFAWRTRSDLVRLADAAAPAAVAMLAGWHAGCLVRDTCLGTPSDLPWAVAQSGSVVTRHPVELYAALALAIGALALVAWKHRRPAGGVIAATALSIAALGRLATEPMRPGLGGDLAPWYAGAAITSAILLAWLVRRRHPDPAP